MATEKNLQNRGRHYSQTKSSENCISIKTGFLKYSESYRFLYDSFAKTASHFFKTLSLDSDGMQDESLEKKLG